MNEIAQLFSGIGQLLAGFASVAALTVGGVFLLNRYRGFYWTNLSLVVKTERQRFDDDEDWLLVNVLIKKLDRASVKLHEIRAQAVDFETKKQFGMLNFHAVQRFQHGELGSGRTRIIWGQLDDKNPLLNLTPGDEMQVCDMLKVPTQTPVLIEVVLLTAHVGQIVVPKGQWQASVISLPLNIDPKT